MGTKRSIKFLNFIVIFLMLFSPVMDGVTPASAQDRAGGVVEVDGTPSFANANTTDSINFSHTTGTGDDRLMLVGIAWNSGSAERDISNVTFSYGSGPTILTLEAVIDAQASSQPRNSAIYKVSGEPPSGESGTVTVTFNGSVSNGIVAGAANFDGVDQTTPLGTPASNTGSSTTPSLTLTTGLSGDELVFDNLFMGGSTGQAVSVGADQDQLWYDGISNTFSGSSVEHAVSSSVTMSWTPDNSAVWVITAVPINPAEEAEPEVVASAVPSNSAPTVGDTITVDINIDMTGMPGEFLGSFDGSFSWDPAVLSYDSDTGLLEGYTGYANPSSSSMAFSGANATGVGGSFTVLTITFDVVGSGDATPDLEFSTLDTILPITDLLSYLTVNDGSVIAEEPTAEVLVDGIVYVDSIFTGAVVNVDMKSGSGDDRLMLVGVSYNCSTTGSAADRPHITSVTFTPDSGSAVPLVLVDEAESPPDETGDTGRWAAIYFLEPTNNPEPGTDGTIAVTFSATFTSGAIVGVANFSGVNQDDSLGTPGHIGISNDVAAEISVDLTTSGSELVFDTVWGGGNPTPDLTKGGGQSLLWHEKDGNTTGGASIKPAEVGTTSMTWSRPSNGYLALVAVPINPAPLAPPCYALTLSHSGEGSDPIADPSSSTGCIAGEYVEGEVITLTPAPASGWEVDSWTGTDASDSNVLTMPAAARAASVLYTEIPPTCYALTLSHSGAGSDPVADPLNSTGCISGEYVEGEVITLTPAPATGWAVDSWTGTDASDSNILTMPAAARAASVIYAEIPPTCYALTLSHSGEGSDPVADPTNSAGCSLNYYIEGEVVTLTPAPASGWEVDNWTGTDASDSNILTMPAAARAASVHYAEIPPTCYALTLSHSGEGSDPVADPLNSTGCISGEYVDGEVITLTPAPASGWEVDIWTGTDASDSNILTMPAAARAASVAYSEIVIESVIASVIPSDAAPEVGDSITVTINIDMNTMEAPNDLLGAYTGAFSWNPAILSYASDDGLPAGFTGNVVVGSGIIDFNGINTTGAAGSTDVLIVTFNVVGPGDAGLDLGFTALGTETATSLMSYLTINQGSVIAEGTAAQVILVSSSSGIGDGSDSISFAHTTGSGVNRLMLVGISWNSGEVAENIDRVTFSYGTTVLELDEVITEQVTVSGSVSGPRFSAIYSLLNPPSDQAGTLEIEFDDTVSNGVVAGAATFAGVNPANPLGEPGGNNGGTSSDPSVTLDGLAGTELIFDNVFLGGQDNSYTLDVDPSQTALWNDDEDDFDTNARGAASIKQATSTSVTMNWTPSTQNWWAHVAVPINPALGGVNYYELSIAVNPVGAGTTDPPVGVRTYVEGDIVDISASSLEGYEFESWVGCDSVDVNVCHVTMNSNKSVTANFSTMTQPIDFTGTELLGRPTDQSISIKIVPDEPISFYYDYGTVSGSYSGQTSTVAAAGGEPVTVVIDGLSANTEYFYRMQYSTDGGNTWIARDEYSFFTQRAKASSFTFDITTDSHVNILLGDEEIWEDTLEDVASDEPDFLIDMGDTFDIRSLSEGDVAGAESSYKFQLNFFNNISHSTPIYLIPGNHEQQEAWHLTGDASSLSVIGTNAQKKFYLNPVPDGSFYTGDPSTYPYLSGDQLKEDYYAWEWGDALFVVISPYWYTTTKPYVSDLGGGEDDWTGSGDSWDWTLGLDQFEWLKTTLEESDARYKLIFMHQLVTDGSYPNQVDYGHGGANFAHLYEWGGYNENGTTWGWDTERPGWGDDPIHQVLLDNGVSAVFHAHDHQYAYEVKDGIVYQEVPSAGFDGDGFSGYESDDGYTVMAMENSGHLRVRVSPAETCVDYIQTGESSSAYTYCFEPPETMYELSIGADPSNGGTTSPAVGVHNYAENDVVPVSATPATGYEFDHWSGACEGSGGCSVTMVADKSVTAHFALLQFTLSIGVTPSGAGTTSPAIGDHLYDYGSEVTINAVANPGYEFAYWSGDCEGTGTCEVTITENTDVLANFTRTAYNLTVAVDPAEGGTTIPSAGVHPYLENTQVAVVAEPAAGYVFDHWSGNCSGSDPCSVFMDGDKSVTAHFAEITYDLTINVLPEGAGTTVPAVGVHPYVINSEVSVLALPGSDYLFVEWTGACTGSEDCDLVMDEDKEVTANFILKTFDLTIEVEPAASGTTAPAVGVHTYDIGSVVDITPTPAAGYEFAYWSGECTGTGACQVTIEDDTYVMAHFVHTTYDLTIVADPAEGGTTTPMVGVHPYLEGTPVVILAEPAAGYEFISWSGACSGSGTCSVTMDMDKTVTANFAAITYDLTVDVDPAEGGTTVPAVGVHTYEIGSPVSVTAEAAEHYLFVEWTGNCTGTGPCNLVMDGAKEVIAVFELEEFDLTVDVDPAGTGTTSPAIGTHLYPYGSEVSIIPTPEEGYEFAYWTGDCSGTGACQVTIDGETNVVAHFMTATYDLTITVDPSEGGTTSPSAGVHPYLHGTEVNIIPTAAEGYFFHSWGGDCSGSGACNLVMDGDKNVIANFLEAPKDCIPLTIDFTGFGALPVADPPNSVGCDPGEYEPETVINLSGALPDEGWYIGSWFGTDDDSSTEAVNSLIMPSETFTVGVNYVTYGYIPMIFGGQ